MIDLYSKEESLLRKKSFLSLLYAMIRSVRLSHHEDSFKKVKKEEESSYLLEFKRTLLEIFIIETNSMNEIYKTECLHGLYELILSPGLLDELEIVQCIQSLFFSLKNDVTLNLNPKTLALDLLSLVAFEFPEQVLKECLTPLLNDLNTPFNRFAIESLSIQERVFTFTLEKLVLYSTNFLSQGDSMESKEYENVFNMLDMILSILEKRKSYQNETNTNDILSLCNQMVLYPLMNACSTSTSIQVLFKFEKMFITISQSLNDEMESEWLKWISWNEMESHLIILYAPILCFVKSRPQLDLNSLLRNLIASSLSGNDIVNQYSSKMIATLINKYLQGIIYSFYHSN